MTPPSGSGDEPWEILAEHCSPGGGTLLAASRAVVPSKSKALTCHGRFQVRVSDKEVVRAGYEAIGDAYTKQRDIASPDVRLLEAFAAHLAPGARVLDAGCGGGRPVAGLLARRFRVIGLDFAGAQLRILRDSIAAAHPVAGDMTRLPFRERTFDGIISYYAIIHVPRKDHRALLEEFHRVLRTPGVALLCMGEEDVPGEVADYMGTQMYWSHYDARANRSMLIECGYDVLWDRAIRDFQNPSAVHRFFLVRSR